MPRDLTAEKLKNTLKLFSGINLFISPLYLCDSALGLVMAVALNTYVLSQLYTLGESLHPSQKKLGVSFFEMNLQMEFDYGLIENASVSIVNGANHKYNQL
jgi:hypothetical protein